MRQRFLQVLPALAIAVGFVLALGVAQPAQAAPRCVIMKFLDKDRVVIPTDKPIIAIIIGDKPVMEDDVPPTTLSEEWGAETTCPASLLAQVRAVFEDNCISEQRRAAAATEHKAPRAVIDKGCTDIVASLGEINPKK